VENEEVLAEDPRSLSLQKLEAKATPTKIRPPP